MPAVFSDHMVLQQGQNIALWGRAKAGQTIEVHYRQQTISTEVDADGRWRTSLKPESPGDPDSMIIRCGDEQLIFDNVLVGEVWLCSGQSNMEMPLTGFLPGDPIMNSEKEIEQANYPQMRMFTVKRDVAFSPKDDCAGQWQVCTPMAARYFSATAYFFGRTIYRELNVPVGLIHTSWGGTPAQSWMDARYLSAFSEFDSVLKKIESARDQVRTLDNWLGQCPQIQVDDAKENKWAILDFKDEGVAARDFNDQAWKMMDLPKTWETSEIGQFDGVVWFRRTIDLPPDMVQKDLTLQLGPVDDMDITFFNGVKIGETQQEGFWKENRVYTIPADLTRENENVIAVRVMDHQGGGGIFGDAGQMNIYMKDDPQKVVPIAGAWKYLPVAEYRGGTFFLFETGTQQYYQRPRLAVDLGPYTPTTLYNAMINPLVPYTMRGIIWYQGESNTGNPKLYTHLFPAMIRNWRIVWKQGDFPFYFVQIAPYDYGEGTRSQELREAQMKALQVPNTGMAVTLDIGNPENIHPANKQEVGRRLALWALAKTYGKAVAFSGPLYRSMEPAGDLIILSFDYAEDGLTAKGKSLDHFQIAGKDRVFRVAEARIQGNMVVVSSQTVPEPVAVRYLWDNTSEADLFNKAGLPASSFRTDDWEDEDL